MFFIKTFKFTRQYVTVTHPDFLLLGLLVNTMALSRGISSGMLFYKWIAF